MIKHDTFKQTGYVWAWVVGLALLGLLAWVSTGVVQTSTTTKTETIPYETTYVEDDTLALGETVTRTRGEAGIRVQTYEVKTKRGEEISRELVSSEVIKQPQDAVVAKGTKPVWHCHDTTSYDRNPYNDNYCEYSDGTGKYVPDSEARRLDPEYTPGKSGAVYYNNF